MDDAAKRSFGVEHFLKASFAGGVCDGLTHGVLNPMHYVKTRKQLKPDSYPKGIVSGMWKVAKTDGPGALTTGMGATAVGHFVQGAFQFGGVELLKTKTAERLGQEKAWKYRMPIYLGAAACAEFVADIFLCPMEAVRVRLMSDPSYASGTLSAIPKMLRNDGIIRGFYSGFLPVVLKQVPYTTAKFVVQGYTLERLREAVGTESKRRSEWVQTGTTLASGIVAGVVAAIISHPADTLLSLVSEEGAGGSGSVMARLSHLVKETGSKRLLLDGLGARCTMRGCVAAGQFTIFDKVMQLTGVSKFEFVAPRTAQ